MEACDQLLVIFSLEGAPADNSMEAIIEGKEGHRSSAESSMPDRGGSRFGSESRANEAAVFMQARLP
jgi:hypothetical protein